MVKTIVFGLDGATWKIINPLLGEGKLPNIENLIKNGASGKFISTVPPMTPSAWTSIITGVNPGKHGIYDFIQQDKHTYEMKPTDFSRMKYPAIWDIFNFYNKKVGIMNFPLVFPPPEVDCFFISGIGVSEGSKYAYPYELLDYLKKRKYRIHSFLNPEKGIERQKSSYFQDVKRLTDEQCEVAIELIRQNKLDLFWFVFQGTDLVQHYLWGSSFSGENLVELFYQYVDEKIGEILDRSGKDCNIFLISDHGFTKIKGEVYLNSLLEQWGYLKRRKHSISDISTKIISAGSKNLPAGFRHWLKKNISQRVLSLIQKYGNSQLSSYLTIDWDRTKVFSYGYMGQIYIHQQNKYSRGIVDPNDYKLLRDEIKRHLKNLKDPRTGEFIVEDVFYKEELFNGDSLEDAPDIIFNPREFNYMVYANFGDEWFCESNYRIANHDMEGVFIMKGSNVKKGIKLPKAAVVDFLPTFLYAHNLPILNFFDGKVILDAFRDDFIEENPIRRIDIGKLSHWKKTKSHEYSKRELVEIEKNLQNLGYL